MAITKEVHVNSGMVECNHRQVRAMEKVLQVGIKTMTLWQQGRYSNQVNQATD